MGHAHNTMFLRNLSSIFLLSSTKESWDGDVIIVYSYQHPEFEGDLRGASL